MDSLFAGETLRNSSEAKAGLGALPLLEKLLPEQGHVTAVFMSHCSLCTFLARYEIVGLCYLTGVSQPVVCGFKFMPALRF